MISSHDHTSCSNTEGSNGLPTIYAEEIFSIDGSLCLAQACNQRAVAQDSTYGRHELQQRRPHTCSALLHLRNASSDMLSVIFVDVDVDVDSGNAFHSIAQGSGGVLTILH
jgi:hypothetical protein